MESALRDGGHDPALRLIETLRSDADDARLTRHLARMARGAAALGWAFDAAAALQALCVHRASPVRLRLTLDHDGRFAVETANLPPPAALWRLKVASGRLASTDPWLTLKSTRRAAYDAERAALPADVDEAIFVNERGEVCDGTITTVFFDRGQGMRTPPLTCGLLPGVLREELACGEEVLLSDDLPKVRLWVGNSLRGLIPARLWRG